MLASARKQFLFSFQTRRISEPEMIAMRVSFHVSHLDNVTEIALQSRHSPAARPRDDGSTSACVQRTVTRYGASGVLYLRCDFYYEYEYL